MNDLLAILEDTNLSVQQIIELLNEVLEDADSQDILNAYARKNSICPSCYCDDFHIEKSYENDDADGNRGIYISHYICKNCGGNLFED